MTAIDMDERVKLFATAFREKMNTGMAFSHHGAYRMEFYKAVTKTAEKVRVRCFNAIAMLAEVVF